MLPHVVYDFSRMKRNRGVAEALFELEVGPGVDVTGSHEPVSPGS